MTATELCQHLTAAFAPVRTITENHLPYLLEFRNRYAKPGCRVPVEGNPTWGKWVREHLGISERHVRRLLAKHEGKTSPPRQKVRGDTEAATMTTRSNKVVEEVFVIDEAGGCAPITSRLQVVKAAEACARTDATVLQPPALEQIVSASAVTQHGGVTLPASGNWRALVDAARTLCGAHFQSAFKGVDPETARTMFHQVVNALANTYCRNAAGCILTVSVGINPETTRKHPKPAQEPPREDVG